jgi:NAD(P)-dependent dehydrogenase (short-subunit alcohol dehydrogenase family)
MERTVKDYLGYGGKVVVINGAASGMGEAATKMLLDLGAEVYALDIQKVKLPVKKYLAVDLADKASIDAALAQIPDKVDRVFACAGLPGPPFSPVQVVMVNLVGNRYMVEALLPRVVEGGSVTMIASVAGKSWRDHIQTIDEFLAVTDFDHSRAWLDAYFKGEGEHVLPYLFSKECILVYVMSRAWALSARKIRINALSPGATQTPMMPAFHAAYGKAGMDALVTLIGRYATPEDQAGPLLFLGSDMAAYVSGHNLIADYGCLSTNDLNALRLSA